MKNSMRRSFSWEKSDEENESLVQKLNYLNLQTPIKAPSKRKHENTLT
jgi:hypothetical protein